MNGLKISRNEIIGKRVLVRADLDVEGNWEAKRFEVINKLIAWLLDNQVRGIGVIGHGGRGMLEEKWKERIEVNDDLRSDKREEDNDAIMARELCFGWDVYINEAFGTSHRKHTSVDALPRLMKQMGRRAYLGPRFVEEMETLDSLWQRPGKKVLIVGGAKADDKGDAAVGLEKRFDVVLRGGKLLGATLRPDGLDITDEEIARFKKEIATCGVVVMAGPVGKYEDPSAGSGQADKGTREILEAMANCGGFKVIGGGDTELAAEKFRVKERMDWVSVGGGAMLAYLANGTLPGLEAVV